MATDHEHYLVSEDASYQKIWLELQALAWNNRDIRARLARVNAKWRAMLTEAFGQPRRELLDWIDRWISR